MYVLKPRFARKAEGPADDDKTLIGFGVLPLFSLDQTEGPPLESRHSTSRSPRRSSTPSSSCARSRLRGVNDHRDPRESGRSTTTFTFSSPS